MYKLFENHVYTAHSVVARKVLEKDRKSQQQQSSANSAAASLRINDEITIIPQPARNENSGGGDSVSRLRQTASARPDKRSRVDVIDLSDDEDQDDGGGVPLPKSQVTITKVPAPRGFPIKNNKEPPSKRSRPATNEDDDDTE